MAKASVRVSSTLKNKGALAVLMRAANKAPIEYIEEYAQKVLAAAAQYTPRYSGATTQSWHISLDKNKANTQDAPTHEWEDTPAYHGGIYDPKSTALINKLLNQNRFTAWDVAARLRVKGSVSFYIYNTAAHAKLWLDSDTPSITLRSVNEDYWTMEHIKTYARNVGKQLMVKHKLRY